MLLILLATESGHPEQPNSRASLRENEIDREQEFILSGPRIKHLHSELDSHRQHFVTWSSKTEFRLCKPVTSS